MTFRKGIIIFMVLGIAFFVVDAVWNYHTSPSEYIFRGVVGVVGILILGMLMLSGSESLRVINWLKKTQKPVPKFKIGTSNSSEESEEDDGADLEEKESKKKGLFEGPFKIKMPTEARPGKPGGGKPFGLGAGAKPALQGRALQDEAKLFGTAGIRGITNIEITPLLVLKISQVYGDWLGNKGTVAVGYDTRYGAVGLAQSASAGLAASGINVQDCGCIPTGGLANFIVRHKLSGGILITGSHMPYNMIGLMIMLSDGAYLPEEVARELENRFNHYDTRSVKVLPEALGEIKTADNPLKAYKEFLLDTVDRTLISSKRYKVLVDPANGTAGAVLPEVLRELGCQVTLINGEPKPVPARPAEPRAGNLQATAEQVRQNHCDLGIATDVDADRVLFIDEAGNVLSEDLVGAIFARAVLAEGEVANRLCVTPINSSGLIEHTCSEAGIKLEYCPIGQPATLKVVKNLKASFSYEESGKYYFTDEALWPDGILASLKLLEIMATKQQALSVLASTFPKFYQVKHNVPVGNNQKEKVMQRLFNAWQTEGTEKRLKDITVDGLKRIYEDKSWVLIRASGTEPLIRVYADAPSRERAEELVKWGEALVTKAMS